MGPLHLKNVLYCKKIAGTVISLGYFAAWDGLVEFDNVFTLIQNNIRFPTIIRQYRCFLSLSSAHSDIASSESCVSTPNVASMQSDLWHSRLGHLGIHTLNKTISKSCVTGLPEKKLKVPRNPCGSCSLAKSQHRPFISDSRGAANCVGDFVAADLMGPYPDSLEGFKYVMVIQDVFSRLASVVGLSTKAAAPSELLKWISKFELQTECKIKTVRTDNAGEFTSKAFEKSLSERSIIHELAVPYEHHQNGQVERTNRTLMEMTRSFLVHAKLPVTLWMHAMKHAAWIFNRLVHADAILTPFQIVMGRSPSFEMIRTFGCRAYLHDIEHDKKIRPRSTALIHIGIAETSNGWLLWDPCTNKVVRGASVIFHEHDLPSQLTTSTSLNPLLNSIEVSGLEAVIDSIQLTGLGDFSLFEQFHLQDAALDSISSLANIISDAPNSFWEAMASHLADCWKEACEVELGMMADLHVWDIVQRTLDMEILGCRWVFAVKRSQTGDILCFKARLVAQGFKQILGINFAETFASLRLLLAFASKRGWPVKSFDVKSAFLHSPIDHEVYVRPPEGLNVPDGHVLRLRKALYGTKQAGRCWWLYLKGQLSSIGFFPNPKDQSTYTFRHGDETAFLWIHVDDGLLTASSPALLTKLQEDLSEILELKWDAELASIIGIRIRETNGGFYLDQPMLIDRTLVN
jgi:hypothetical protein